MLLAAPAAAQDGVGLGIDFQRLGLTGKAKPSLRRHPPLSMAVSEVFGPAFWEKVGVSTAGATSDLAGLVREGCYKRELIQLVMLAADSGKGLKAVLEKRKKGARLAAIAADFGLDFDRIYERSLAVEEIVDAEYLRRYPERKARKRHD